MTVLEIVYEDESVLVVIKPAGVLSQPGKTVDGSLDTAVKEYLSNYDGPTLVHRLDMDTSGLMVFARDKPSHLNLHKQFEKRLIQKRYTAVLENEPIGIGGQIRLPLRLDLPNRPKQIVCRDTGKLSVTSWYKCSHDLTRIRLFPSTGRTHQLRVVSADKRGLGAAIVGDRLYGVVQNQQRLLLHADTLGFSHPVCAKPMTFFNAAPF